MNRLNKFLSVILAVSVIAMSFSFCLTVSAAQNDDYESENAFEFLKATGIITDDVFVPEQIVSRAQFVKYAISAVGLNPGKINSSSFSDVSPKSEYAPYIEAAYDLGIISGSGNAIFNPDSPINLSAAVKILGGILGYGELAELNGGYEAGYYMYASRYGVLDGFNTANADRTAGLTMNQVVQLLANAVKADVLEIVGYVNPDGYEIKNRENTLLSLYFDIYEETGILDENTFGSLLSDESDLDKNQVKIDGVVYNTPDIDASDYLGYEIDFYYRSTSSSKTPELVWFEVSENCNVIEVNHDNLVVTSSGVSYEDEKGRLEDVQIDSVATYIYNGKMKSMSISDLSDVYGKVVFVSNDGDKKADIVFVYEYKAMIVKGVSNVAPTGVSVDGKYMSLEVDDDTVITYEKGGKTVTSSVVGADNVLLIASSEGNGINKKHIIISDISITGTIDMIDDDSVYVDGIEYKFDRNLYSTLRPGLTCRFLVDAFGSVRSCEKIKDVVYGYLKAIKSFGMEGGKCKIFTENNRWVELDLADKIRFNGENKTQEYVMSAIGTEPSEYRQLIRYTVNDNAEVNMIETATEVKMGSDYEQQAIDNDVFRIVDEGSLTWRNSIKSLGDIYTMGTDTVIFVVPSDLSDDGFSIRADDIFFDGVKYNAKIYDTDILMRPGAMILEGYKDTIDSTVNFMVVNSIRNIMNREGESTMGINGYWNGAKITIPVDLSETLTEEMLRSLEVGDVIQFSINDMNEITEYICHKTDADGYYLKGNLYALYTVIGAKLEASDVSAGVIRFEYAKGSLGIAKTNSATKVFIYDSEEETITSASLTDVLPGLSLIHI